MGTLVILKAKVVNGMRNWVKYISDRMGKRFVVYDDIKVLVVEWHLVCFRKICVEAINQLRPGLPPSSMNVNYMVKYLSVPMGRK